MSKRKPKPGVVWQAVGVRLPPALMRRVKAAARRADPEFANASAWVRKLIKRELEAEDEEARP